MKPSSSLLRTILGGLIPGLLLCLSLQPSCAQANSLHENFGDGSGDGNSPNLPPGWSTVNLSQSPEGVSAGDTGPWSAYSTSADGPSGAYLLTPPGSDASYALTGFDATSDSGDPTPHQRLAYHALREPDQRCHSHLPDPVGRPLWRRRLPEILYAQASNSTAAESSLSGGDYTSVGLFTGAIGTLGSPSTPGEYPQTSEDGGWVTEQYTLSGLPLGCSGNIAFRYLTDDASNASYIGLADIIYDSGITIPEPSTWAFLVAGFVFFCGYVRRAQP